ARLVDDPGDLGDRGDRADEVRGRGDGDQPGAPGELVPDVVGGELTGVRVEAGVADSGTGPFRCPDPGADVGIVVQPRDDHLVAGRPAGGEGAGEVVGELGGAAAEDNTRRVG